MAILTGNLVGGGVQHSPSTFCEGCAMANLRDVMIQVESTGNPMAISVKGARGLMQITKPALDDWNTYNSVKYNMDDMYDKDKNIQVSNWYLTRRIPSMLRTYGIKDTLDNRLWAYNAGIGRVRKGILPKETSDYIKKIKSRMGADYE